MAHHTGGKWRRLLYYSAPTIGALLDAPDAIYPKIKEASPNADREFGEICGFHEDYIWEAGIGSRGAGLIPEERGKVGFSVYFYCDMSKEERADEIVEEAFAPIYNSHVEEGKHHLLGLAEAQRRRQVAPPGDHDRHGRQGPDGGERPILGEIGDKHEAASNEFNEICGSHQDFHLEHRPRDAIIVRVITPRKPPQNGAAFVRQNRNFIRTYNLKPSPPVIECFSGR